MYISGIQGDEILLYIKNSCVKANVNVNMNLTLCFTTTLHSTNRGNSASCDIHLPIMSSLCVSAHIYSCIFMFRHLLHVACILYFGLVRDKGVFSHVTPSSKIFRPTRVFVHVSEQSRGLQIRSFIGRFQNLASQTSLSGLQTFAILYEL
jgi:hypothetical protein